MNPTVTTLKQRKAELKARLLTLNAQLRWREPTAEERAAWDADIAAARAINLALDRAQMQLARAEMQRQVDELVREAQEPYVTGGPAQHYPKASRRRARVLRDAGYEAAYIAECVGRATGLPLW